MKPTKGLIFDCDVLFMVFVFILVEIFKDVPANMIFDEENCMSKIKTLSDAIDLPDLATAQHIRNVSERELHGLRRMGKSKRTERMRREHEALKAALLAQQVAAQADSLEVFNFTYQASRHERGWIVDSLGGFYEQRWLDDVLRLVKGGKEANVYLMPGE